MEKKSAQMGKRVDISVIVPVYNVEKYLPKCLESLIGQTYQNIEILCIDDGSTDHSLDILNFYKQRDERIKVLKQNNLGPSAARNKALAIARGEYVSFVDADDFLQWNAYEILMLVAGQNDLDLIIFGGNCFPWEERVDWVEDKLNVAYRDYRDCTVKELVFQEKSSRPFLWLHFIRRELLERTPRIRFDETMDMGEDQLFQFQYLPRVKKAMAIQDKLYNYRVSRSGSLMQLYADKKIKKVETHLLLTQKVVDAWKKENYLAAEEDGLVTWIVSFLYWSIVHLPKSYRKKYAASVKKIFQDNHLREYLVEEEEQGHLREMWEWNLWDQDETKEIEELKNKIEKEKYEIQETVRSRAFRLGRLLTKKAERIGLSDL